MINDDREISCDIGSMAIQIDHEPTKFMPGILCYRSIAEESFNFMSLPVLSLSLSTSKVNPKELVLYLFSRLY